MNFTAKPTRPPLTAERQKAIFLAQQEGYAVLERERHENLRALTPQDTPHLVSALFGGCPLPPMRESSGLIEQQRWFASLARHRAGIATK